MIDINKISKSALILVKIPYLERYRVGEVTGISIKHNTISVKYGDLGGSYNVPLSDCKPYYCATYKPNYLSEVEE